MFKYILLIFCILSTTFSNVLVTSSFVLSPLVVFLLILNYVTLITDCVGIQVPGLRANQNAVWAGLSVGMIRRENSFCPTGY